MAVLRAAVEGGAVGIKIPSVDIVHIAVPVIVDPVSGDLARVRPHRIFQLRVAVVDAGVDHGYDHLTLFLRSLGVKLFPGREDVDVDAGGGTDDRRLAFQHPRLQVGEGDGGGASFTLSIDRI